MRRIIPILVAFVTSPAAFSTDYDNPKSDTGRDCIAVEYFEPRDVTALPPNCQNDAGNDSPAGYEDPPSGYEDPPVRYEDPHAAYGADGPSESGQAEPSFVGKWQCISVGTSPIGGGSSRFNMQIEGLGGNSYRASSPDTRAN